MNSQQLKLPWLGTHGTGVVLFPTSLAPRSRTGMNAPLLLTQGTLNTNLSAIINSKSGFGQTWLSVDLF